MDINNAMLPINNQRPMVEGVTPRVPPTQDVADTGRERRTDRVNRDTVDPAELQRRVEQKQTSQAVVLSRFQSNESFSLKTQEALNTYQQTEVAAQEYEGGVLVGIDLFA